VPGIDPSSFVATGKTRQRATPSNVEPMNEKRRQAMMDFLELNRDRYEENGIIAASLWRDMKEAGVEPISSPAKIREYIAEMHSQGILRADKKVRGGSMSYKFVGSMNGASDGEA